MRFLHVSDTHVGFAAYGRLTPQGLNQREADFFDAFARSVDLAIAERVDFVLHSGDLFDAVRPTNRAISHVLDQAKRLHEAKIPFIVISGNHEAPRLRETGAVLRLLDFMPGTYAVYKGVTEVIRIGACAIHATPHATDNEALLTQLRAVRPAEGARWNVATLHAGVMGVGDFRTGEFHEQVVPQNELPSGMDYVALGHYHGATEIAPNVWYAGSTERCTIREVAETKTVNLVDLAAGTVTPRAIQTRRMVDLPKLRCEGMPELEVGPTLYKTLRDANVKGAIARLRVTGIPHHVYATLDFTRIREMTVEALHFDIQYDIVRDDAPGLEETAIGELAEEFSFFLDQRALAGDDRDALLTEARSLLEAAARPDAPEGSA